MNLFTLIFGARPARGILVIGAVPKNVRWRHVHARGPQPAVRAWRVEADHQIQTPRGSLRARGGEDFIIETADGDHRVVRSDIFERTYEALGGGLYRKRDDVDLRYFTLDRPALVKTLEGEQEAQPGDWIMQGVAGELWPVPRAEAERKYEHA